MHIKMKTVHNKSAGFNEKERTHENQRGHCTHGQQNRNYYTYNGDNSKGYHNKHVRSFRSPNHVYFNRSRGKSVRYSAPQVPYLMDVNPSNITPQCSKEAPSWSNEALELERKQQLSNVANKLLNKLKMWNTDKKDEKKQEVSHNGRTDSVSSPKLANQKEKQFGEPQSKVKNVNAKQGMKTQRISHENGKRRIFPQKTYWVKKSQVSENTQKKIQQNIIGELMIMPKENLNKVLMNPKIHPKIEQKMAKIVKENRLLLAQKFRNLAESKMNSQGQSQFQSKFVNDVENLIDTDLAIDLCQLPPELIKQMGDIFQLDFDSSLKTMEIQENNSLNVIYEDKLTDKATDSDISCLNSSLDAPECSEGNDFERIDVKLENQDADIFDIVEIEETKIGKISIRDFANFCNEGLSNIDEPSGVDCSGSGVMRKDAVGDDLDHNTGDDNLNGKRKETPESWEEQHTNLSYSGFVSKKLRTDSPVNLDSLEYSIVEPHYDDHSQSINTGEAIKQDATSCRDSDESHMFQNNTKSPRRPADEQRKTSDFLGKDRSFEKKSCEVQTNISLIEPDYSIPFQTNVDEDAERSALLEETRLIDKLIHELNLRKFFLFLKIIDLKSCEPTNGLKNRLIQTIINRDKTVKRRVKKFAKRKGKKGKAKESIVAKQQASGKHEETDKNIILIDSFMNPLSAKRKRI